MVDRIIQRFGESNKNTFILIFVVSFFYKFTLSWQSGITMGWQDEIGWRDFAASHSLLVTLAEFDSGYPTPFIRGLSYVLTPFSTSNFLIWHIAVLLFISASISILAFSKVINRQSQVITAGILCTFPSFDLLLLHNLSYWAYVPLFVVLTNVIAMKVQLDARLFFVMLFFVIASAKPQILISIIALILISIFVESRLRKKLLSLSILILLMFLIGRCSGRSLDLNLDYQSLLNYLFTICAHFFAVNTSIPTLLVFATSKYLQFSFLISFYFLFATGITIYFLIKSRANGKRSILALSIALSFATVVSSLYVFANSGWSQNDLLISSEYLSLFSRHYLPVILNVVFLILLRFHGKQRARFLILAAILQNVILQIFLFKQLYKPV
jgi:hypothetical protein